jgi:hypothetical protein
MSGRELIRGMPSRNENSFPPAEGIGRLLPNDGEAAPQSGPKPVDSQVNDSYLHPLLHPGGEEEMAYRAGPPGQFRQPATPFVATSSRRPPGQELDVGGDTVMAGEAGAVNTPPVHASRGPSQHPLSNVFGLQAPSRVPTNEENTVLDREIQTRWPAGI